MRSLKDIITVWFAEYIQEMNYSSIKQIEDHLWTLFIKLLESDSFYIHHDWENIKIKIKDISTS